MVSQKRAVGHQRVVGDHADLDPAGPLVETLGVVARGVEHQQRLAELARHILRRIQDGRADAAAARAAMHQHLRQVGAMRLVLGQRENQLRGAADPVLVFGHDDRALARLQHPWRRRARRRSPCRA